MATLCKFYMNEIGGYMLSDDWDSPESKLGYRALGLSNEYRDLGQILDKFKDRVKRTNSHGVGPQFIDAMLYVAAQYATYERAWLEYCRTRCDGVNNTHDDGADISATR